MIIVDASVGFKWIFKKNELYLKEAKEILKKHLGQEEEITVPDLFFYQLASKPADISSPQGVKTRLQAEFRNSFYEISNTLATKSNIPSRLATRLINKMYSFNLTSVRLTQKQVVKSIQLSKKYSTSVYDVLYAVVAKEKKTVLITADENFILKTGFKFVKYIKDL